MRARCTMLAHTIAGFKPAGRILVCPTSPYRFHYHAVMPRPANVVFANHDHWPCQHRHQSVNAAIACADRLEVVTTQKELLTLMAEQLAGR